MSKIQMSIVFCILCSWSSASALHFMGGDQLVRVFIGHAANGSLTPANNQFHMDVSYDYLLMKGVSATAGTSLGINTTTTDSLLFHLGSRYRYQQLPWPVHISGSVELVMGELFNVRTANLLYLGSRFSLAATYFLTKSIGVGLQMAYMLGGTVSIRSAFYHEFQTTLGIEFQL